MEVLNAGKKVANLVATVRDQIAILNKTLTLKVEPQLTELNDIFEGSTFNQTALHQLIQSLAYVQNNITIANNSANDIRKPLAGINMTYLLAVSILKMKIRLCQ